MNLKKQAAEWLKSIVGNHIGSNIRRYKWTTYVGEVRHNTFGGITFLSPCEGKVVDLDEQFVLVKTKASEFCIVAKPLLDKPVAVGDKVGLSFYKLKRFDGSNADGSEDGALNGFLSFALTGASTQFPVKWEGRDLGINARYEAGYAEIGNPYLQDLIKQMEGIPVNEGLRKVVNILTDASPTELSFNDPPEEHSATNPPAIRVRVNTGKLVGQVEIAYIRVGDHYKVTLTPDEGSPMTLDYLYFDQLGEALLDGIDDGSWKMARVTMLKAASKKKAEAV